MSLGPWQLIIIAIVILVLFGHGRISEMMGDFGKGIKSFKQGMNEDDEKPAPPARTSTAGRLVRQLTAKLGGPAVVKEAQTMSAPAAEAAAGYSMNNFTMTDARRTSGKSMDAVRV